MNALFAYGEDIVYRGDSAPKNVIFKTILRGFVLTGFYYCMMGGSNQFGPVAGISLLNTGIFGPVADISLLNSGIFGPGAGISLFNTGIFRPVAGISLLNTGWSSRCYQSIQHVLLVVSVCLTQICLVQSMVTFCSQYA